MENNNSIPIKTDDDETLSKKYELLVNGNRPNPSKFETDCALLAKNSYKCLEVKSESILFTYLIEITD